MSIRKKTLIKKLTALIEFWPIAAREQLLEAAWRINGELRAGLKNLDRTISGASA